MLDDQFHVYDTTLRDGAQQEGLNLTVADKLVIARHLDGLGVGFIEGGWPGAIPKDTEFFRRAQTELDLKHATLAAFGATRKAGVAAADDPQVAALRESRAPVVTLVAKSHDRHVELALRTTLDGEPRDDRRHGPAPAGGGAAGLPRRRALLRRLPVQPGLRARVPQGRRRGRRGRHRPVRHQRRHDADRARRRRARGRRTQRGAARHPLPRRHRLRRRQHPGRGRGRRHPRAGHRERLRRAVGQREPVQRGRGPPAQEGQAGTRRRGHHGR